jgi:hemoglobin/transferrin/lactoferrin receptor protein
MSSTRSATQTWMIRVSLALTSFGGAPAGLAVEEILVVGARLPRPVQDVVGSVDVVTREDLLRRVAVHLDDVVRYTPGISVARADTRFGSTEMTVRGLSGNRVTTLIDGVPVADQFDIGAFSNAGQDYLIADTISRVEILRGPASTLFGSDALGGVVAFVSRDPEEYLDGERWATSASAGYSGADRSRVVTGAIAGRRGELTGVLHVSALRADELDAAGTSAEDPIDRRRQAAKLKLHRALEGGNVVRLNAQVFDEQVDSRPEAILGFGRQFANTTVLTGDDRRRRYSLQGEIDFSVEAAWVQSGRLNVFGQRTRVDQVTDERRDGLDPPVAIRRGFDYRVDEVGGLLDMESRAGFGGVDHRVGWGLSLRRARIEELRDGELTNLLTGERSRVLLGETMPVRDFPNSTVTEAGAYLHDEISLGSFTIIPAARVEWYRLDAAADALYRQDNPTTPVVDVEEWALAPKLGVQWQLNDRLAWFAQYARGFRAPPFEDVNIGLDIPQFNIRALPNPDLEAETSDGIELGLRYRGGGRVPPSRCSAPTTTISSSRRCRWVPDPLTGVLLFQSRNIDRAASTGST